MQAEGRTRAGVLGISIDVLSWDDTIGRVVRWAQQRETRYVAICNVHMTVTAVRDPGFARVINGADMVTPDGAPVAWMLRRQGFGRQERISGPDLMVRLFKRCADDEVSIYFYGSTGEVLEKLQRRLERDYPPLTIAGAESPPFRLLAPDEDAEAVTRINDSGAGIVFVGLGCPKQERWMAEHRGRVNAVMIGVGAAFDFYAGTVKRAPEWMRRCGLEWLHRVASEPRRLWKRYLVTNSLFIWGAFLQLTGLGYRKVR